MTATVEQQKLYDFSRLGIKSPFAKRYDNYIGGKFVPPTKVNISRTSARSSAHRLPRSHDPQPRTSISRLTRRTKLAKPGEKPRQQSAR